MSSEVWMQVRATLPKARLLSPARIRSCTFTEHGESAGFEGSPQVPRPLGNDGVQEVSHDKCLVYGLVDLFTRARYH